MANHGLNLAPPGRRLSRLCSQYPLSVLWVLTMTLVACVVGGLILSVIIILTLETVLFLHSLHLDRMDRRRR